MSEEKMIERVEHGTVSVLTLRHRPHNLIGHQILDAILLEMDAAKQAGARALVIRSGLRHFSAGAEIEIFEKILEEGWREDLLIDCAGFLKKFESFPLPVVASIHGVCVGGGLELALACDYIIAAATSKIGSVEGALGLHPLMGAIQRATNRVGALRAKEMSLLGRRYDPATLERWGLINLVVPDEALESTTMAVATELANGPTVAHTATKQLVQATLNSGVCGADEAMVEIQKPIWKSHDLVTGIRAYRTTGAPGNAKFEGR